MKHEKTLLITGATGFVGGTLATKLITKELRLLSRRDPCIPRGRFYQAEICPLTDYSTVLKNVDVVVHAAARVHVMADTASNPLEEYLAVNVAGTLNLAKQAAQAGVKRFVFISSIKVNGESTACNKKFSMIDQSHASDDYGISKAQAEVALRQLAAESMMEVVIIRPPLVYGPSVKANFAAMMNLAKKNLPLPLGAINNKRSLVALDNLVDLIITCIDHPKAANQTFLVSDDHDVSTTELLQMMTRAAGKTPRLLPVPVSWLKFAGKLIGKQAVVDRLCGNLQVDITHTKETLNWSPPISMEEGIRRCFVKEDLC
ncbi:UDP-glucose 4-epimerase family protein [Alishewanella tabrizica]|uniref:UDP-glucose 4-epimerase n=1 Tax=Alishewanella tabrizica TaxID=671278 RepID=A0ABQ2WIZ0_9ALTE|nr:SDR family oxidoreductase [Alishewanella tabrizica]GGW58922.1 UDP-glucose 4-epimerase [Alishewanella tabrizica]